MCQLSCIPLHIHTYIPKYNKIKPQICIIKKVAQTPYHLRRKNMYAVTNTLATMQTPPQSAEKRNNTTIVTKLKRAKERHEEMRMRFGTEVELPYLYVTYANIHTYIQRTC